MKAAAYVRYSSDNQREESIEAQLRAIREYSSREGITIVKIYADEARSATTDNRPEFQHMMSEAPSGLFDCIIVHKLDRFSRDRYDSAYYKRYLKKNNIKLISVLENLNDSPESIILESVLEGMAEYYSRNLAREVMKGMKETAYECKHAGGIPPLGYDVAPDKTYVINEAEAMAVRLIFTMYADGYGYSPIIEALNEKCFKTKLGKPFGKNSLHEILVNEKYTGVYVFNKTERKIAGARNGHKRKSDDEIIRVPGGIPAIVSEKTWSKVQERMKANKHRQASYRARVVYLLSGHIYCGNCNGAMVGKHGLMGRNHSEYGYYECSTRKRTKTCDMKPINKDYIEHAVVDALYTNFFSPKIIDKTVDEFYETLQGEKHEIPTYLKSSKKQLSQVNLQIKHVVDAIANGMYHESMKEKMNELEASKSALELRISEAQREFNTYSFTKEEIKNFLKHYTDIQKMSPEAQKKAIDMFVDRVVVFNDKANMYFSFCPIKGGIKKKETTRKSSGSFVSGRDTVVEARGVEPLSEDAFTQFSPSASDYLKFPWCAVNRQTSHFGIL